MAEIITDILGAERSGLYATFSIITPSTTVRIRVRIKPTAMLPAPRKPLLQLVM